MWRRNSDREEGVDDVEEGLMMASGGVDDVKERLMIGSGGFDVFLVIKFVMTD